MKKFLAIFIMAMFFTPDKSEAQGKIDIGFWTQAWYQHVENGKGDHGLNDFMLRRGYHSVKGQSTEYLSFFTHIAVDRLGQEGLNNSAMGLGRGLAFRDLWITLVLDESFKVQAGRMYVPLTRNYGTTSTKALLTTDLSLCRAEFAEVFFTPAKWEETTVLRFGAICSMGCFNTG